MLRLPRHAGEPVKDVFRRQRRRDLRIGLGERAERRLFVCPGRLFQLKGAALARAAAVGIGEAAGIEHHRRQSGRVEAGGGELGMRRV